MVERIKGVRQSLADLSQSLKAPKTWLGSDGVNVLQVLGDLIDLVEQTNTAIADHKHGPTPPPDNTAEFAVHAAQATRLSTKLKPITE